MKPILSILICSVPIRAVKLYLLVDSLRKQILMARLEDKVEIISLMDCKRMTVGDKRNYLKDLCDGDYMCYIDDDDKVSADYVTSIMEGIKSGADVITFEGLYLKNGTVSQKMIYTTMKGDIDERDVLYRLPNHFCPVRREIYKQCNFTPKSFGEDKDYANEINKLINNEYHIKKELHIYDFNVALSQTVLETKSTAFREDV